MIRLDRRLFSATVYPADYGFVPDTLASDGDPLDVLVLLEDPTFPGLLGARSGRSACSGWRTRRAPTPRSSACRVARPASTRTSHDLAELPPRAARRDRALLRRLQDARAGEELDDPWLRGPRRRVRPRSSACRSVRGYARARRSSRVDRAARAARRGCPARRSGRRRPRRCGRRVRAVWRRCAISSVVRPLATRPIARWTRASVLRSRLAVASSSSRIAGSTSSARAQADELALPGRQRAAALGDRVEVAAARARR